MVTRRNLKSFFALCWLALCIAILLPTAFAAQSEQGDVVIHSTITAEDCVKCHENIVLALAQKGKAHQSLCLDCHRGHPPADRSFRY